MLPTKTRPVLIAAAIVAWFDKYLMGQDTHAYDVK
jgi:hypothetical protein